MPIQIENTGYVNNDYGRYSSAESIPVREGYVSSYGREGLTAGTTVTGEIVEKEGNQVTIRLAGDQTISAKLSGNADIEVGMKMTFEVTSSNNQTALRPLFSNLANSSAAMSALKAAGLPVNNTTLTMTDRMMTENMPVNRNALAEMFRNVSTHSNVSPESIVQMTKLNMPLTETNVIQFDNYRNFEHQITNDLTKVTDGITDLFKEAVLSAGDIAGNGSQAFGNMSAGEVITEVLDLIDIENLETVMPSAEDAQKAAAATLNQSMAEPAGGEVQSKVPEGEGQAQDKTAIAPDAATATGAASVIKSTVDGLISDVKELFMPRQDESADIPLNSNLSLTGAEQLELSTELQDIMILAEKGPMIKQPLDPSEIMNAVKELVEEYPPGVTRIEETENPAYSQESEEAADDGKLQNAARDDAAALKQDTLKQDIQTAEGDALRSVKDDAAGSVKDAATALAAPDKTVAADAADKTAEQLLKMGSDPSPRQTITDKLTHLLRSEGFSKLLKDTVKAQMSIKPEDVSQNGKIEELYSRIQKTSARISQLMENIGRTDSAAAQSSAALNDNVNFMNQLNEFVNYVQLPLKMAGEDANGELYVYTNKKNLSNNDGNYSALLHLDMEHLGPMDIYVTMRDHTKVSTNFYLQSEELLDFMESHIDILTKRLAEKGYDTSMRVTKKEKGEPIRPMADEFTKDEARADAPVVISRMRFDVRA